MTKQATTYILKPAGLLDTGSPRVTRHTGAKVRKVQPRGCPTNGTMRMAYVERVRFPARTSGMHDMTFGDLRTLRERHDHGDCTAACSICRCERVKDREQ